MPQESSWKLKDRKNIKPDEVSRLFTAAKNSSIRDYIMLALTANMGLRVGELVQLKFEDFLPQQGIALVKTLKQKEAVVDELNVDKGVFELVDEWKKASGRSRGWLFPGKNPEQPITTRGAQKIFERAARAAGIETDAPLALVDSNNARGKGIHSLRHYRGTVLATSGADMPTVARQLRHKSLQATQAYFDTLNESSAVRKVGTLKIANSIKRKFNLED